MCFQVNSNELYSNTVTLVVGSTVLMSVDQANFNQNLNQLISIILPLHVTATYWDPQYKHMYVINGIFQPIVFLNKH